MPEHFRDQLHTISSMSGFEVLALVNLILLCVVIGLVTYAIVRMHRLWTAFDIQTLEFKKVIGRMVREINLLNAKKYVVDTNQTQKIKNVLHQQ